MAGTTQGAEDELLILDPVVQSSARQILQGYTSPVKVLDLVTRREIDSPGNLGKRVFQDYRYHYTQQENGLWHVALTASGEGRWSASSEDLTLCGLVTLMSALSSTRNSNLTSVAPVGKSFVPFGLRYSVDTTNRMRVTSLEADPAQVCAPLPGARIVVRYASETQIRRSGLLGNQNIERKEVMTCLADAATQDASKLQPALAGEALAVTCETERQPGSSVQANYVFLRDAGVYVQLKEKVNVSTAIVQIQEARYGP